MKILGVFTSAQVFGLSSVIEMVGSFELATGCASGTLSVVGASVLAE
eukprot:CAMPEP_0172489042 /NCGR_PEP_ID=MMETSP1066-20121228/18803_1 /TAXON_ID=671091 /ORGANISM="Coscinodiscus wailesii, Strain CCMP2513" /LENGTH=46 /DNA_ID= /DNA_START= /DNA_END= /DNA_ORIENTATION=